MNQIVKKEWYRLKHMKLTIGLVVMIIALVVVPLVDYDFYRNSLLEINGLDYLHLLLCGGSGFFLLMFPVVLIVCVGLVFHKEFKDKTIYYETMHGIILRDSMIARGKIVILFPLIIMILVVAIWFVFSCKNGFVIAGNKLDMIPRFLALFVSGIHIVLVTEIATFVFESGYKAIIAMFLRYIVGTVIYASICYGDYYVQLTTLEPMMSVGNVLEDELIMNNYWIILGLSIVSIVINVAIWVYVLKIVRQKKN